MYEPTLYEKEFVVLFCNEDKIVIYIYTACSTKNNCLYAKNKLQLPRPW